MEGVSPTLLSFQGRGFTKNARTMPRELREEEYPGAIYHVNAPETAARLSSADCRNGLRFKYLGLPRRERLRVS